MCRGNLGKLNFLVQTLEQNKLCIAFPYNTGSNNSGSKEEIKSKVSPATRNTSGSHSWKQKVHTAQWWLLPQVNNASMNHLANNPEPLNHCCQC